MAIYYSRLSLVSRSCGHSAVAAAAYRAGTRLHDERTDQARDYSKRKGVLSASMRAPAGASWALDLASVWNRAEQAEVRRNARTARELVIALPAELSEAQNERLAHEVAQDLVDRYGVAVLVAVHRPDAHGDDRNVHCHLLMSTRVAAPEGFGAKVRILDDKKTGPVEAEAMRSRVAERINIALAAAGHTGQVDPRPLKAQARDAAERGDFAGVVELSRTPTRHQGRAATAMARRGSTSEIVMENAAVRRDNAEIATWCTARARTLRRVAQARAARSGRAMSTRLGDRVRPQNGIGAFGRTTRATGKDADLLNAQAQAAEQTARAARDASERQMDLYLRAAEQQAAALLAYFDAVQAVAVKAIDAEKLTSAAMNDRHVAATLARARSAWAAFADVQANDDRVRRNAARAEHRTALVRRGVDEIERAKPSAWKPLTRRQWAKHRRQQRAALNAHEQHEQERRCEVRETGTAARTAQAAWQAAHHTLIDALQSAQRAQAPTPIDAHPATDTLRADLARSLLRRPRSAPSPSLRPTFHRRAAPR